MEVLLAIGVASAVIFFGLLISLGNEKQRKAIDHLSEQAARWAIQDLKIKREHLVQSVQVSDPLSWLNKTASRVCGCDLQLQLLEIHATPQSLVCSSGDGSIQIIFSLLSPADLRGIKRGKHTRLSHLAAPGPLSFLPKHVTVHELSVLNGGYLFDVELALAWKALTKQPTGEAERVWMYVL